MLCRYEGESKQLTLLQLPRDMYIEGEDDVPKLNHIYAACRANGMGRQEALSYTASTLSEAFSLPIDAAVCMDLAVFSSLVDSVGGIPIDIPFDMTYKDEEQGLSILLKKGRTVLDGKTAEQFVRYRSGYVEGDLGRVDAQKLFLAAGLHQVLKNMSVTDAISVFSRHYSRLAFCGDARMLLSVMSELFSERKGLSVQFLSIPGEAVKEGGTWYYVINRKATCEVIGRLFASSAAFDTALFDKDGRFYNPSESISNIYFSANVPYRIYNAEEMTDINILKKD
jgi:LCP family protein required for cell wall assembly